MSRRALSEAERERLERLRRALLNVVAQFRESDPTGRYTLSITIVLREQSRRERA